MSLNQEEDNVKYVSEVESLADEAGATVMPRTEVNDVEQQGDDDAAVTTKKVFKTVAFSKDQMMIGEQPKISLRDKDDDAVVPMIEDTSKGFYLRWHRLHKEVEIQAPAGSSAPAAAAPLTAKEKTAKYERSKSLKASFHAGKHHLPKSGKPNASTKVILNQVSGSAAPGEILACMGPSGSGKTSLMNCLSGRSSYQEGCISINGDPLNSSKMKRLMSKVAYVKQADVFFQHLTVRDQLTYTALLRLPEKMAKADKYKQVDQLLTVLRLQKVADSPIFMLSGGEKKRVNIGTELLTTPSVILLDEPTSGLDSSSAVSLLKLLRTLARDQNKTIITTIHQPSSSMFMSFDKLIFISEGNVVYFGTPHASLDYLASDRVRMPCPPGYNASDHWMDLLVIDNAVEEERAEEANSSDAAGDAASAIVQPRLLLQQAWDNEAIAKQMDAALTSIHEDESSVGGGDDEVLMKGSKYPTSWWAQFTILLGRCLKNSRSAIFTPMNLVKSVLIGVVCGMLWFQKGYTESSIMDVRSYYFFTMTFWVFDSMFTSLTSFPMERVVILKERASGSYRLSAYFMAKVCCDMPVRIILPFLYMLVSYWMAGFDYRASVFFGSVGCTLLSVVSGEAIGLFLGAAIYDMDKALTFMTVFALALMLLGGFFVENVPIWIQWGKFLSPFKYAFDSSLQVVFDRPVPCDGSGKLQPLCPVEGWEGQSVSARDVLDLFKVQGSIAFNIGLLLVICFVPRYLAYVALRSKKDSERS